MKMHAIAISLMMSSCVSPRAVRTPAQQAMSVMNIGLCSAVDITPDAISAFRSMQSMEISVAEKVFSGLVTGLSALSKGIACYAKDQATQRSQSGETSVALRSDEEIMRSRSLPCDISGQAYAPDTCRADSKKLAAFLIISQIRVGNIKYVDTK